MFLKNTAVYFSRADLGGSIDCLNERKEKKEPYIIGKKIKTSTKELKYIKSYHV